MEITEVELINCNMCILHNNTKQWKLLNCSTNVVESHRHNVELNMLGIKVFMLCDSIVQKQ
jgi:hypothetical protein